MVVLFASSCTRLYWLVVVVHGCTTVGLASTEKVTLSARLVVVLSFTIIVRH